MEALHGAVEAHQVIMEAHHGAQEAQILLSQKIRQIQPPLPDLPQCLKLTRQSSQEIPIM
jgi:hypothetical protein